MTERDSVLRNVRAAVEGTPYVVIETDRGFDLTLDIIDEKWFGLYFKEGLNRVYTHHVELPGDGTYTVTDDSRTVEWHAGVPTFSDPVATFSGSLERTRGRVLDLSSEKVWAFAEDLRFGSVVDYTFSSEDGRRLIRSVAKSVGLKEQRGRDEKIGLFFAIVGGAGAVVTLIVLAVLALLGEL